MSSFSAKPPADAGASENVEHIRRHLAPPLEPPIVVHWWRIAAIVLVVLAGAMGLGAAINRRLEPCECLIRDHATGKLTKAPRAP